MAHDALHQARRRPRNPLRKSRRGGALAWVIAAVLLLCIMAGSLLFVQYRAWRQRHSRTVYSLVPHYPPPRLDAPTAAMDLGKGVKLELVRINPGEFQMGSPDNEPGQDISETPIHRVTIDKTFYMGKFEVTQAQWNVFRGSQSHSNTGDNFPADGISWNDAKQWCQAMSQQHGVTVRLPTEAEWEYACRAGTTTPYAFGRELRGDQANFNTGDPSATAGKTVPVGTYPPNAWGLYDMHGNVWEWCEDTLQGDYDKAPTTGVAWVDLANQYNRVRRGGSWNEAATNCRSAVRFGSSSSEKEPDMRNNQVGFRVVVDVPK